MKTTRNDVATNPYVDVGAAVVGSTTHITFSLERLAAAMGGVIEVRQNGSELTLSVIHNGPSKDLFNLTIPPELGVSDEVREQLYAKITRTILLSMLA